MKPTSDNNKNADKQQAKAEQTTKAAVSNSPVPQNTTPSFAPSPTSDKDIREAGLVDTRSVHAPAGSLTLATFGEPHQSLTSPKSKKNN